MRFICPFCKEEIFGFKAFKNHFDTVHKQNMVKKRKEKKDKL